MNVLILGSGGREHTLAWKIAQSKNCKQVFIAPGNGGTAEVATNLAFKPTDFEAVKQAVKSHQIDLLVVGPEDPLVNGIVDELRKDDEFSNLKIVGPSAKGAKLEGSKEFAKQFMIRHEIPTAKSLTVTKDNLSETINNLSEMPAPYVLKADGLAAGKGVIITEDSEEAKETLKELIEGKKFGSASEKVLIEQFLDGIEVSFFVLTDGKDYQILPEAKDYKRIGEGDKGLNTGGMGAISPVVFADEAFKQKVENQVIKPTVEGLKKDNIDYKGFIFFGLMNVKGNPYVIEYNVRMGDPETQAVLPRIQSDFLSLLVATANGELNKTLINFEKFTTATVVSVSKGYPEAYEKGKQMQISEQNDGAKIFHAGTKLESGELLTNGGRVIAITGKGNSLREALKNAYKAGEKVSWEGKTYRSDIGKDLLELGQ